MVYEPLEVAVFMTDGVWCHDVANAIQVFGGVMDPEGTQPCHMTFVAPGSVVRLDHGLSMETLPLSSYQGHPDILCAPGFTNPFVVTQTLAGLEASIDIDACKSWFRSVQESGAQIAALGTGTFVLGWMGLLDGVKCTIHYQYADAFSHAYPDAHLFSSSMIVHDRDAHVWTCAGGASCLDMCLALLMHVSGRSAVHAIANNMNLWSPRSLDVKQDALGVPDAPAQELVGREISELLTAVRRHISHQWSVSEMAWYVGMSSRSFQRHFMTTMGQTPMRWLTAERMGVACGLLEQTDLPLSLVASRVGLSGPDVLRKNFLAQYGETPSAYRKRHALASTQRC